MKTYDNSSGSFDWKQDTINITGVFNDGYFSIRFLAEGDNSPDIEYWAVDNISARYLPLPPTDVLANFGPDSSPPVYIDWNAPATWISEWQQWDDGVHHSSVGFGTGKETWTGIAARWTPELLLELKGAELTAIGFIPSDLRAFFKVAVWAGNDLAPVYSQATGNLSLNEWNIFQLDQPVKIDITKDLYVGYNISTYTGYPISCDDGPAIDSSGNMTLVGVPPQWKSLLQITGIDVNWNVKAYFERDGVPIDFYNLYRSIDGGEPTLIAEPNQTFYVDTASIGLCCYMVTSVFNNESESVFSDEACLLVTDIPVTEEEDKVTLTIYPNPASDVLFIESAEVIKSVIIFDSRGMTIEQLNNRTIEQPNGRSVEQAKDHLWVVPLAGLAPGLYFVRVETDSGVVGRKVVIR